VGGALLANDFIRLKLADEIRLVGAANIREEHRFLIRSGKTSITFKGGDSLQKRYGELWYEIKKD